MSSETNMRQRVVRILKPLNAVSVENGVGAGTPDVNYVEGWLELKSVDKWPSDPEKPLLVDHFTPQQRLWIRRRALAGGRVHVLLKVAGDWLLIPGYNAATDLGKVGRSHLLAISQMACLGKLDEGGLLTCLTATNP